MDQKAIGGYFELELPQVNSGAWAGVYKLASARSAFYALLMTARPDKVWIPYYICDAMLSALDKAGVSYQFYGIDLDFHVEDSIVLKEKEWLLYVNYFGICTSQQRDILQRFSRDQVVFDHSQAFFSDPLDCLATIYSPRKFFGVPDGGLLVTALDVDIIAGVDTSSISRINHLIKRLTHSPEFGYGDYLIAEQSLEDITLKKMSRLTESLLHSIDVKAAKAARNRNFMFLHERLKHLNKARIDLNAVDGPLCYPCLLDVDGVREKMIAERVYVPIYWEDTLSRVSASSPERYLVEKLLPLPCDQRYGEAELQRVVDCVYSAISGLC